MNHWALLTSILPSRSVMAPLLFRLALHRRRVGMLGHSIETAWSFYRDNASSFNEVIEVAIVSLPLCDCVGARCASDTAASHFAALMLGSLYRAVPWLFINQRSLDMPADRGDRRQGPWSHRDAHSDVRFTLASGPPRVVAVRVKSAICGRLPVGKGNLPCQ